MASGVLLGELLVGAATSDPTFGPCRWNPDYSCCTMPDGLEPAALDALEDAAAELAWALSGRQFGECSITLRPCRADCNDHPWDGGVGTRWPHPAKIDGAWLNLACGACGGQCSCGPVETVVLPGTVVSVTQVIIDGEQLVNTAYRLDNGHDLIRQDGGRWPHCQDLSKPAGQAGTWTVTAIFGRPVPQLGRLAVAEIACEMAKACASDPTCQLPANWQTINRAGIAVTAGDLDSSPSEWLPFTREFLRAFNPNRLNGPSQVWSPDLPMASRTL